MSDVFIEHDRTVPPYDGQFPTPGFFSASAVMVSVAAPNGVPNIIPLTGWGFLNRLPLQFGIAICVDEYTKDYFRRASLDMLKWSMDFCLNFPHNGLSDVITQCGSTTRNNPDIDKFKEAGVTPGKSVKIKSPFIVECPVSYECIVRSIVPQGSHDLFLGEVVGCHTNGKIVENVIDEEIQKVVFEREDGSRYQLTWKSLPEYKEL